VTAATNSTPILEARGLTRSFGAVRASDSADFDVHRGEVVFEQVEMLT
jgi:simple sugar transport system ATP-binding protein